ncbi:hypothetical protein [Mycolicibacterium frederiksbergense]|uniref:hypothetical protein n=1 Tax=Mycolicibacterium frederiksbergense TaxID=117567 RepID=UPI0024748E46|nr:hypothetical protein [Mycolicibacterium frederiksbergense]
MSEPVGQRLPTYTARVTAIRAILSKHLPVGGLVQSNRVANPIRPIDCLSASWGADATTAPTLTISVLPVADFAEETEQLRYGADATLERLDLRTPNAGSYEVRREAPDEFALVQVQLSSVWVVVGHCEVYLAHRAISPEKLIEAAVEVARTVGAAPYIDDFVPAPLPTDPPARS